MGPRKGAVLLMDRLLEKIAAGLIFLGLAAITATILWHMVIGGTIAIDLIR